MLSNITLMGILNITPDSFSDGGEYVDPQAAVEAAQKLWADGALIVDIGADATGPGSKCVGPKTEWERLSGVLPALVRLGVTSIDTHHAATAEKALNAGAIMINDVSAAADPAMFRLLAGTRTKIVLMATRPGDVHSFESRIEGDVVEYVCDFLKRRVDLAISAGLNESQIILDSGMGAFLSEDPADSFSLLERYDQILKLGFPCVIGISRKGFLGKGSIEQRDLFSVEAAKKLVDRFGESSELIFRVHNVAAHRKLTI